ncbi:MAG: phosphodiester glycosidase family protein [Muribaculaceae bacterium]|nr:phosphodiester glycosidase family protein [Muribaculaceae bacterium]
MRKCLLFIAAFFLAVVVANAKGTTVQVLDVTYDVDTLYHAKVGPGTTQTHLELTSGTKILQVFYLTVDKRVSGIKFEAVCAKDKVAGTATTSSMAKSHSTSNKLYFAGTNGDFFTTSGNATNGSSKVGTPTTSCTVQGEPYKTSNSQYQFTVDTDGVAYVGRINYYTSTATCGDKACLFKGVNVASPNNGITIYTPRYWGSTNQVTDSAEYCQEVTARLVDGDKFLLGHTFRFEVTGTPSNAGDMVIPNDGFVIHGRGLSTTGGNIGARDFVGGLKAGDIVEFNSICLVNDKSVVPYSIVSGNPKNVGGGQTLDTEGERGDASALHPRTCLGHSVTNDSIIMMVVDGRSSISNGVRTSQLADIMRFAHAYEATNVDGGGSSTLYTSALGVRNHGSDGQERAVGNAFFATVEGENVTDKTIASIDFADYGRDIVLPKYGLYTPVIYGYNQYGVLVDTDVKGFTLSCDPSLGEITNDGTTFFGNGDGYKAITATYNGMTASIAARVDASSPTELKYDHVLIDNYRSWDVELRSIVNGEYMPVSAEAFSWTSADNSVASITEKGTLKGVNDGSTTVTGEVEGFSGTVNVTVECPTDRFVPLFDGIDVSTIKISKSYIKDLVVSPLPDGGFALDFGISSTRGPSITLTQERTLWSLPDGYRVKMNPGNCDITSITFSNTPANGRAVKSAIKDFGTGELKEFGLNTDEFADPNDIGIYPIKFNSLAFIFNGNTSDTYHLEFNRLDVVYANAPDGVEVIAADGTTAHEVAVGYYNLQGQRIVNPSAGQVVIRVATLSDGTVRATKILK